MARGSLVIKRRYQIFVTSERLGFEPCYTYNYVLLFIFSSIRRRVKNMFTHL